LTEGLMKPSLYTRGFFVVECLDKDENTSLRDTNLQL